MIGLFVFLISVIVGAGLAQAWCRRQEHRRALFELDLWHDWMLKVIENRREFYEMVYARHRKQQPGCKAAKTEEGDAQ